MEAGSISVSITADASGVQSAAASAVTSLQSVNSAVEAIPKSYQTTISAVDNATARINAIRAAVNSIPSSKTVTVNVVQNGSVNKFAAGTMRAPSGLAVINDERGIPDPRELVVHNGRGYIFNGRDVPVVLSENDRVYTAQQTRRIMNAAGIPHYAGGKNTEEKFMSPTEMMRFNFDMEYIDAEEYYRQICEYRDNAYTKWSEEYNKLTKELKKYSDELAAREIENAEKSAAERIKQNEALYEAWEKSAENWRKIRSTYGDWEEYGDSLVDFYERCIERVDEMFRNGIIDYRTYADDTMNYQLKLYKAQEDEFDRIFDSQKKYIRSVEDAYDERIYNLKYSWEAADRSESIAAIKREMRMYSGAVTNKGMNYYSKLSEQLRELEREQEIAELEREQKQTLDALNQSYESAESNKSEILSRILETGADISALVSAVVSNTSALNTFFSTVSNITNNNTNNSVSINANDNIELNYFLRQALKL